MGEPYRVSIIAKHPDPGVQATQVDVTGFIDGAADTLAKAAGMVIKRAATILDLDDMLTEAETEADGRDLEVQIVGHGSAGQLMLGMTWLDEITQARAFPYFVIDTNPVALGFLRPHVEKFKELRLVGCCVGSPDIEASDLAVNGRSLTYCLGELLQCHVTAATDFVGLADFNASGLYRKPTAGWQWAKPGPPTFNNVDDDIANHAGEAKEFTIQHVRRTLLPVGDVGPHEVDVTFRATPVDRPELSYATREVHVELAGVGGAEFLGNGRYLAIGATFYAVEDRAKLARAMRSHFWGRRT
jgi:hypothetical protein